MKINGKEIEMKDDVSPKMIYKDPTGTSVKKLLTPMEICSVLNVKTSTVYAWTHEGFIPCVRLGRLIRFDLDEVMTWVGKQKQNGRSKRKYEVNLPLNGNHP